MYLARKEIGPRQQGYILRETYASGGILRSRDLADLGRDPGAVFVYDDDSSFHLNEEFLRRLHDQGVRVSYSELEELFFPFIDPYIRQRLQPFRDRSKYRNWRPADADVRRRAMEETRAMDRRRLQFLRLGRSAADTTNEKTTALYTILLDKSRDEIEQLIMGQEQILKPREYQSYLFGVFDLQRFFKESYSRTMPQALNRERLDTLFVEEICRCAADREFWEGYPECEGLQAPLIRYLIMYFDGVPEETPTWARWSRTSRSRRFNRSDFSRSAKMSRSEAFTIFDLSGEQLAAMTKRDLTRLYRQKAMELHPDTGGDAARFIRLSAAYHELLPSLQ
jgi:hypothetical protein